MRLVYLWKRINGVNTVSWLRAGLPQFGGWDFTLAGQVVFREASAPT